MVSDLDSSDMGNPFESMAGSQEISHEQNPVSEDWGGGEMNACTNPRLVFSGQRCCAGFL